MYLQKNSYVVSFVLLLMLSSCGGSSQSSSSTLVEQSFNVSSDTALTSEPHFIVVDGQSIPLESASSTVNRTSTTGDDSIVALSDALGNPMLVAYVDAESTDIELSVESSAHFFVMQTPMLYGVTTIDSVEMKRRINQHEKFAELVDELKLQIDTSPCPMEINCSIYASMIAEEIAQDIDISQLITVAVEK